MKVYICLDAQPWEKFTISAKHPEKEGETLNIVAQSSATTAGYLPIFWTAEAARAHFPDAKVLEGEVADDWHPMLNAMKAQAEAESSEGVLVEEPKDEPLPVVEQDGTEAEVESV